MNILILKFLKNKQLNKKIVAVSLGALMFVTACGKKGPEGVVATVNGTDLTEKDYVMQYAAQRNQYVLTAGSEDVLSQPSADNPKKTVDQAIKENTLKNMIQMELVKQDAAKSNIAVDQSKVDEEIKAIITQMGGEEIYKQKLEALGSTPEFYKSYLTELQLMKSYYETKIKEFEPTDEEIQKYYDKNKDNFFKAKASHILVETVEEANKLKKELNKGADFAEMAKENSKDPGSAANGGSLGEFKNGDMVAEFNDVVKILKVGEISDPVKSKFGYHIVKVDEKSARTLDEVKEELKQQLTQAKFTDYIEKMQKDAKISEYLDATKEIQIPEEYQLKNVPGKDAEQKTEGNAAKEGNKKDEAANAEKKNESKN